MMALENARRRSLLRPVVLLVTFLLSAGCAQIASAPPAQADATASYWTADYMRTKPGQQDRYIRSLDANWAHFRRIVLEQGGIRSFRVLITTPTPETPWDVVLLTEYPDSATYERAEEIFRPVMRGHQEVLIDGMSARGPNNPLVTLVGGNTFKTVISGSAGRTPPSR